MWRNDLYLVADMVIVNCEELRLCMESEQPGQNEYEYKLSHGRQR